MKRKLFFLLCALLTSVGMWAQSWTGGTLPETSGDYYLYNVASGKFLAHGSSWGTHATVDNDGLPTTITKGDGVYTIGGQFQGQFLNTAWMDQGSFNWTFTEVDAEKHVFTISNGTSYLQNDGSVQATYGDMPATANQAYWQVFTRDDLINLFDVASPSAPVNASFYISNPGAYYSFGSNFPLGGTTFTADNVQRDGTLYCHTKEQFNKSFENYQELTGMKNGKYKFRLQGFYRGANPAYAFAGSDKVALPLLDTEDPYKGQTGNNDLIKATKCLGASPENYISDYVETIVTNGTLRVGVTSDGKTTNWSVFTNLELIFVDPYISDAATSFTSGNTMEAGKWYSYTVPTDGDYTFSATEGIVYSLADGLASEVTGTAVTSTTALPAGTVYIKSTTSQALTINYVEPVVENGTYYLYDATNKVFLTRGNNWGTRASVDKYGIPFIWNNYSKLITFVDWEGVYLFFDNSNHASCWLYTDGGSNRGDDRLFAFEATEGGYYLRDLAKAVYIKHDNNVLTPPTTTAAEATIWTLKTKSEHDAIVAAYPTDNKTNVIAAASLTSETDAAGLETWLTANRAAKDYTSHVGTAKFTGSVGDWTWHGTDRTRDGQPAYGTDFAEMFSVSGYFDQTISDLPEGLYKVTVNAFEREKGFEDCNTLGAAGWEIVTAYFDANGQAVQLCSWYSQKEGTNNPNTTGEAASAFNSDKYKNEIYCYVGNDGKLTLKLAKPSYIWDSWVLFNNVTLTYYDTNVSDEDATAILAEANEQMAKPMLATLRSAISDAKETFNGSRTVPNYNALRTAIDASATSVDSYAAMKTNYLDPLKAVLDANKFYSSSARSTVYDTYKTQYDEGTIANATATSLNWKSGTRYEAPVNNMMMDIWKIGNTAALTDNSGLYINTWSSESAGEAPAKDFENPFYEYWVSSGSLPATTLTGKLAGLTANTIYKITANVRVQGSSKVAKSITMQVGDGAETDVTEGSQIGKTERYIGSYSAIGITDGDGNLTLAFNVAGSSNISWLAFRDVNYEAVTTVADAKNYLNARISAASALLEEYEGNVGSGVFQIPTSAETTFSGAITTATTESESGSSTLSSVTTAATTLNTAINAYDNVTLNAPDAEKRYWVSIVEDGKAWDGNAVTFIPGGRNDQGKYAIKYLAPSNANLCQALKFTAVEGNKYKISAINTDGTEQYITTNHLGEYGSNKEQIRTTEEEEKALEVEIKATATEGQFQLYNTDAEKIIANNNNNDMYTAGNCNFTIAVASKATANLKVSSGKLGTFVAPFDVELPEGVKAYSATSSETEVTLKKEYEGGKILPAGTPVIIYGDEVDKNENFTGYSVVTPVKADDKNVLENPSEGALTGILVDTTVPEDAYVLQTKSGTQGFYKLAEDATGKLNRCYVSADVSGEARLVISFDDEDPTAINAIEAADAEAEGLKDGKYLIDNKIVLVKNGVKYSANGQILK